MNQKSISFAIVENYLDLMGCCVVLCWWDVVMSPPFKEGEWSGPKQRSLEGVGGDETLAAGEARGREGEAPLAGGLSPLAGGTRGERPDGREARPALEAPRTLTAAQASRAIGGAHC